MQYSLRNNLKKPELIDMGLISELNDNTDKIDECIAKCNYAAISAPTAGDDSNDGYVIGSIWVDTETDRIYICTDNTAGAAVWAEVSFASFLLALLGAKGGLLTRTTSALDVLPIGAGNDQSLVVDSTQPRGMKWADVFLKISGASSMTGALDISTMADPAAPAAGSVKVYPDTLYRLKYEDPDGIAEEVNPESGWRAAKETWSYASPTTFTIPGNKTSKYSKGNRIKLTQSSIVKYFVISSDPSYNSGTGLTTITVYGGTSYILTNNTIFDNHWSRDIVPQSLPIDLQRLFDALDIVTMSTPATPVADGIKIYPDTSYRPCFIDPNGVSQEICPDDGWHAAKETWTYASADDPTYTFTIDGDKTSKYNTGMRIKLTQTTVRYFLISAAPSYSAGTGKTTITLYGGTDYDLANATISANYWSREKAPQGFPMNKVKWTWQAIHTTSDVQNNPAASTWYNLGSFALAVPIGSWDLYFSVIVQSWRGTANSYGVMAALSTSASGVSDAELYGQAYASNQTNCIAPLTREKPITLTSKTTYYAIAWVEIADMIGLQFNNNTGYGVIRAKCALL